MINQSISFSSNIDVFDGLLSKEGNLLGSTDRRIKEPFSVGGTACVDGGITSAASDLLARRILRRHTESAVLDGMTVHRKIDLASPPLLGGSQYDPTPKREMPHGTLRGIAGHSNISSHLALPSMIMFP